MEQEIPYDSAGFANREEEGSHCLQLGSVQRALQKSIAWPPLIHQAGVLADSVIGEPHQSTLQQMFNAVFALAGKLAPLHDLCAHESISALGRHSVHDPLEERPPAVLRDTRRQFTQIVEHYLRVETTVPQTLTHVRVCPVSILLQELLVDSVPQSPSWRTGLRCPVHGCPDGRPEKA